MRDEQVVCGECGMVLSGPACTFEHQLKGLVSYTQQHVTSGAFALYQPGFVTVGYFDVTGSLRVLADAPNNDDTHQMFHALYDQVNQRIGALGSGEP